MYDYAKTERGMGMKYGLALQSNGTNEEKLPETSPVYADANDANTRFYFTLERSSTRIKNIDEGEYVIPIPDNIYDKPEDDATLNIQDAKNGSQFYFTLEECSEENENDKELSVKNVALQEENKDSNDDIYDTAEETYENGKQDVSIEIQEQDEMNNEDTHVINIQNNANSSESKEDSIKTTEIKEMHAIEIPNDSNDLSVPEKGDEYSRRIGIEEDNNDEYLVQSVATTQKTVNSRSEDEFSPKDSNEIYQNVSECFHTGNNENKANEITKTEQNTVQSEENIGYIDDEILTQNRSEQNGMNNENCHEIQVETLTSDSNDRLSDNNTRNDDKCYLDDDIYENWEDNIIGRLSGESREDFNELGDEVDPNKDFGIIKDQPSGCCYENLRHFRPLVPQDIR